MAAMSQAQCETYTAQLYAALERLVRTRDFRWISHGYGKFSCRSCGAARLVDYGDHEQPATEKREACSASCPWGSAEKLLDLPNP